MLRQRDFVEADLTAHEESDIVFYFPSFFYCACY
jgi:hypothetical protein